MVADLLACFARLPQHPDCPAIFASEVEEIGHVVVGLRYQERHPVLLADSACTLVRDQRPWKIIQAHQTNRHVAQGHGNTFRILIWR